MHPSFAIAWENIHRNRAFIPTSKNHFSTNHGYIFHISLVGFVLSYSMQHKYCIYFLASIHTTRVSYISINFQTNVSNSHEIEEVLYSDNKSNMMQSYSDSASKTFMSLPMHPFFMEVWGKRKKSIALCSITNVNAITLWHLNIGRPRCFYFFFKLQEI